MARRAAARASGRAGELRAPGLVLARRPAAGRAVVGMVIGSPSKCERRNGASGRAHAAAADRAAPIPAPRARGGPAWITGARRARWAGAAGQCWTAALGGRTAGRETRVGAPGTCGTAVVRADAGRAAPAGRPARLVAGESGASARPGWGWTGPGQRVRVSRSCVPWRTR